MTDTIENAVPAAASVGVPDEAYSKFLRVRHFGSLDGVRFLSIFAVLWHHYYTRLLGSADTSALILHRGFLGVDFFFILSGFLITTLLLREEAKTGRFSLAAFYWRRFLRIIPVYFLVVTLVAIITIVIKGETENLRILPYYYLFLANFLTHDLPNLAPTWSLSVEEQYYLIWPLLLLLLPRRAVLPVLGALIALNVAGILGALAPLGIHAFDIGELHIALPNATYAPILMGSALAVMLNTQTGFAFLYRMLSHPAAPLISFAALTVLIAILPADLRGWPNFAIHIAMTISLASVLVREDNILRPLLAWRPIARVGEISYGIYLYHLFALHAVSVAAHKVGFSDGWLFFALYALTSWLMAEISFRTLEAFFRRHRNHLWWKKSRAAE